MTYTHACTWLDYMNAAVREVYGDNEENEEVKFLLTGDTFSRSDVLEALGRLVEMLENSGGNLTWSELNCQYKGRIRSMMFSQRTEDVTCVQGDSFLMLADRNVAWNPDSR